ncbi:MAG: hypothetical protein U0992_07185 [Planctomycetaceae bacterium]
MGALGVAGGRSGLALSEQRLARGESLLAVRAFVVALSEQLLAFGQVATSRRPVVFALSGRLQEVLPLGVALHQGLIAAVQFFVAVGLALVPFDGLAFTVGQVVPTLFEGVLAFGSEAFAFGEMLLAVRQLQAALIDVQCLLCANGVEPRGFGFAVRQLLVALTHLEFSTDEVGVTLQSTGVELHCMAVQFRGIGLAALQFGSAGGQLRIQRCDLVRAAGDVGFATGEILGTAVEVGASGVQLVADGGQRLPLGEELRAFGGDGSTIGLGETFELAGGGPGLLKLVPLAANVGFAGDQLLFTGHEGRGEFGKMGAALFDGHQRRRGCGSRGQVVRNGRHLSIPVTPDGRGEFSP